MTSLELQYLIVGLVVGIALGIALHALIARRSSGSSTCSTCSGCPLHNNPRCPKGNN